MMKMKKEILLSVLGAASIAVKKTLQTVEKVKQSSDLTIKEGEETIGIIKKKIRDTETKVIKKISEKINSLNTENRI